MSTKKIFILLAIVLNLSACTPKETTVFSGQLPAYKNTTLTLVNVKDYFPALTPNVRIDTLTTDAQGNFKFRVPDLKEGYYQVLAFNYPRMAYDIFLSPGDSIAIFQSAFGDTPKFQATGKGAEKLTHLSEDYQKFPNNREFSNRIRSNEFTTALDFKSFIDSLQEGRINLVLQQAIPKKIKTNFIADIKDEATTYLLAHLKRRNYTMTGEFTYHIPEPSYYAANTLNKDRDFNSTKAKNLLAPLLDLIIQTEYKDRTTENETNVNLKFQYISKQQASNYKELLALAVLKEFSIAMFEDHFFEEAIAFKETLEANFTAASIKEQFLTNFAPYLTLAPGAVAPEIALPNADGEIVKLSDFKGSVVYIDFWGTWCYPCIQEIPNAMKLQEEYKNQKVVFLYVALQSDEKQIEEWKKFIVGDTKRFKKYLPLGDFPGTHVVAEKQFQNNEIAPYKINFAPTYVLIDKQGRIVNARANRPKEISKAIQKLLKED